MANLEAVTSSNFAGIKTNKKSALERYLKKYAIDGDVVSVIYENFTFAIYGYDTFQVFALSDVNEADYDNDVSEEFLCGLAPFLSEPLVIQTIGNEKCRFPLLAWEAKVHPEGRVEYNGFKFNQ